MVLISAVATFSLLTLLVIMQVVYVQLYLRSLRNLQWSKPSCIGAGLGSRSDGGDTTESIAVILCLRGADPSLELCLEGLSRQVGPKFQLHIVVDSPCDPALATVKMHQSHFPRLAVHTIETRFETCSLKCSAILTAIKQIPETVELVVLLDADTEPDPNWLADLIRPLADPQVAVTTGNRWFWSSDPHLGTALREIWNAAAIVQMQLYNIAWGGSLAIKKKCLETTDLVSRWQHAFCEDTLIADELSRHGLKLVRVPNLILVNREHTTWRDSVGWIIRQLLTIRLHNPKWPLVQAHALATGLSAISMFAAVGMLFTGHLKACLIVLAGFLLYQITNAVLLKQIQNINLAIIDRRLTQNQNLSARKPQLNRWLAVGLAQMVQPYACLVATMRRNVRWRGIDYRIAGAGRIALERYQPYAEIRSKEQETQTNSIA